MLCVFGDYRLALSTFCGSFVCLPSSETEIMTVADNNVLKYTQPR